MAAILEVNDVSRSFGELRAVDGVRLAVAEGAITGLIGPNGAGKSTLFDMIAGAQRPDRGTIRFRGKRIDGLNPDRIFCAGLARTFQIPRPFPQMTVLENVMLPPIGQIGEQFWNNWIRVGSVARQERAARQRAMEVLAFCGLAASAGTIAGQLSGGQQKLLELARVLMIEPQLILLDEPAAGVNPTLLETLVEKIVALNKRGISFFIIEHNIDMVTRICAPIIVMAQGRVLYEGDGEGLRRDARVVDAYLGDIAA
jgi:ABC-type branched-subunit amino acid transport system ATPase component